MKKALLLTTVAAGIALLAPEELAQKTLNFDNEKALAKKEAALAKLPETETSLKKIQPVIKQTQQAIKKTLTEKQKPEKPAKQFTYDEKFEYNEDGSLKAHITYRINSLGQVVHKTKTEYSDRFCYLGPDCSRFNIWDYTFHKNGKHATITYTLTEGNNTVTTYEEFSPHGYKKYEKIEDEIADVETETFFDIFEGKSKPIKQLKTVNLSNRQQNTFNKTFEYDEKTGKLLSTRNEITSNDRETNEPNIDIHTEQYEYYSWGGTIVAKKNEYVQRIGLQLNCMSHINNYSFFVDQRSGTVISVTMKIDDIPDKNIPKEEMKQFEVYKGQHYQKLIDDLKSDTKQDQQTKEPHDIPQ